MPSIRAILETNRESQQYSGTALGRLRVRFAEPSGKPMGLYPEPFWKPIGRANSTRGQPLKSQPPGAVEVAESFREAPGTIPLLHSTLSWPEVADPWHLTSANSVESARLQNETAPEKTFKSIRKPV